MVQRTFGWVQNPNKLSTLRDVVSIFTNSEFKQQIINEKLPLLLINDKITADLYEKFIEKLNAGEEIEYDLLKGKGAGSGSRANAHCSGIIQLCITAQQTKTYIDANGNQINIKKPYTDDWTSEGYLRWAISTGLIEYNRTNDTCKISDLGQRLICSEKGSDEEKECFTLALLSYPPVIRILNILQDERSYTKFEIGDKLGFKGEQGFTSIPQHFFIEDYYNAAPSQRSDIRSDHEGDSDKYARTIANWLVQMDWIKKEYKIVSHPRFNYQLELLAYKITRKGLLALRRANGYSRNPRIPKIVHFEMLASNRAHNSEYLRKKRATIIKLLNRARSLDSLADELNRNGFSETKNSILDDIKGLSMIGLEIKNDGELYKIVDTVKYLTIPNNINVRADELTLLSNELRDQLHVLNHDYLAMIDLAYGASGLSKNANAAEFENQTAKLFIDELGFSGCKLGGPSKPDIIISDQSKGTIIDNKAYSDGFSLSAHDSDEMRRYVIENRNRIQNTPPNEWWKSFGDCVNEFTWLFVTSYTKGNISQNIAMLSRTSGTPGAVIGVKNMLLLAEKIKSGQLQKSDFFSLIDNTEILC